MLRREGLVIIHLTCACKLLHLRRCAPSSLPTARPALPLRRPRQSSRATSQAPRVARSRRCSLQIARTNTMAAPACFRVAPRAPKLTQSRGALAARSTPPNSLGNRAVVARSSSNGAGPAAAAATEVSGPHRRCTRFDVVVAVGPA